jgi:hypothetical protein
MRTRDNSSSLPSQSICSLTSLPFIEKALRILDKGLLAGTSLPVPVSAPAGNITNSMLQKGRLPFWSAGNTIIVIQ